MSDATPGFKCKGTEQRAYGVTNAPLVASGGQGRTAAPGEALVSFSNGLNCNSRFPFEERRERPAGGSQEDDGTTMNTESSTISRSIGQQLATMEVRR